MAIGIAFATAAMMIGLASVQAQDWPARAVRVIVPLTAGSAADVVPRIVFEQVSARIRSALCHRE